jgi:hypothetical protein
MSDDDMYWPDKYPWSRRPAPRPPARAPVMHNVIPTLRLMVFSSGIVFAALAIISNVKANSTKLIRASLHGQVR